MNKLWEKLLGFIKDAETMRYIFIGICTTIINYVAYFVSTRLLGINIHISVAIAWVLSVIFAYIANKRFVFRSKAPNAAALMKEMGSFVLMRVASWAMEQLLMALFVEVLHMNDLVSKLIINVLVVILNYVFSKLFIFKGDKKEKQKK